MHDTPAWQLGMKANMRESKWIDILHFEQDILQQFEGSLFLHPGNY